MSRPVAKMSENQKSPEEFTAKVKDAVERFGGDPEAVHGETDTLMEDMLSALGYGEGVDLIRATTRWYA
jgi:hypothetical protein